MTSLKDWLLKLLGIRTSPEGIISIEKLNDIHTREYYELKREVVKIGSRLINEKARDAALQAEKSFNLRYGGRECRLFESFAAWKIFVEWIIEDLPPLGWEIEPGRWTHQGIPIDIKIGWVTPHGNKTRPN